MNTLSLRHPGETRSYAQSLALSAFVHGLAIAFAVTLLSDLKLAPEPEPFKWDVAVVKPPAPQQVENQAPAQSKPAPPTPTQAEPQPVERIVQHVVRQEVVREVRQVVQAVSQPAQTVNRTVQAIKTEQSVATPTEAGAAAAVETSPVAAQVSGAVTRRGIRGIADAAPGSMSSPSVVSRLGGGVAGAGRQEPVSTPSPSVVSRPAVETAQALAAVQERAVVKGSEVKATLPQAIEQVSAKEIPVRSAPATKADYGWLAEALWSRVEQLKRYPHLARMNRWEGKVVLRAVIREDGRLLDLEVAESSGHSVLDHDALDVMRRASPLKLKHPLGKPQVVVQVPISYTLR